MELLTRFSYAAEIWLGALLFLWRYPRRSVFPLRLLAAAAVSLAVGALGQSMQWHGQTAGFLGYQLTIWTVTATLYGCFEGPFLPILSACVAGVAAQHIGHHLSRIALLALERTMWSPGLEWGAVAAVYLVLALTLGRTLGKRSWHAYYDPRVSAVSVVIILICTGITRFLRLGEPLNAYAVICTSLYAIVCCGLALFVQFFLCYFVQVNSEYLLLQRISQAERRQYESSRENAEQLKMQYHDLKHKLVSLGGQLPKSEIDSMRSIIDAYDNTYHTGLDPLDLVLNEQNARCRSRGITLTCMGGKELSFVDSMDIYSLFGNILENAITAVEKIEPAERRLISLVIERRGNFVYIDGVNFMEGPVPDFADGLPQTTKTEELGYHGYGLKSVRAITRKYGGDVAVHAEDGIFRLSAFLMDE